jgi:CheY-like chemotaxis protein
VDDPAPCQKELLLVDDNPGDARLLAECLRALPFPYSLSIVTDGDSALAFLQRQAPYTRAPRPDLILLDIHPLKTSGWEVLAWLRTQPELASIPVVMWGGTLGPVDEQERARLQPTQCLAKPTSVEEYQRLAELIEKLLTQHQEAHQGMV